LRHCLRVPPFHGVDKSPDFRHITIAWIIHDSKNIFLLYPSFVFIINYC
jgi:hypothetical protein